MMVWRQLGAHHNALLAFLLMLALSSASLTRGVEIGKIWRKRGGLWHPLEDDTDSSARISGESYAGSPNGFSLLSSIESNGVALELWDVSGTRYDSKLATEPSNGGGTASGDPLKKGPDDAGGGPDTVPAGSVDIQGWKCATACSFQQKYQKPDPNDCRAAYQELYGRTGIYTISPTQAFSATKNTCSIWLINHSGKNITYDYWDTAGTAQWLNGHCIIEQQATIGLCLYNGIGTNVTNGVWTGVCHPSFMNT